MQNVVKNMQLKCPHLNPIFLFPNTKTYVLTKKCTSICPLILWGFLLSFCVDFTRIQCSSNRNYTILIVVHKYKGTMFMTFFEWFGFSGFCNIFS